MLWRRLSFGVRDNSFALSVHNVLSLFSTVGMDGSAKSTEAENEKLRHTIRQWEESGISSVVNALGKEATDECQQLAKVYTALNISLENNDEERISDDIAEAIMQLADEVSLSDIRYANKVAELKEKRSHDIPYVIDLYRQSHELLESTSKDIDSKMQSKDGVKQRIESMKLKAKQYDETTNSILKDIRSRGLKANSTHDAVIDDINQLKNLESELNNVNQAVGEFLDLPPVRYLEHFMQSFLNASDNSDTDFNFNPT